MRLNSNLQDQVSSLNLKGSQYDTKKKKSELKCKNSYK